MGILSHGLAHGEESAAAYTVDYSCRFDGSTSYLERTFGAGDQTKWTYSLWVKRSALDTDENPAMDLLSVSTATGNSNNFQLQYGYITTAPDSIRLVLWADASTTVRVFRDLSAWMHLCLVMDTDQSTAVDKCKLYVNGVLTTDWTGHSTNTFHSALPASPVANSATVHRIGAREYLTAAHFLDGYLADVYFIDGSAVPPVGNFIETDSNGQWVPKEYTEDWSYGTNGFHLDFSDSAELGADASGNANDFTSPGLGTHDQMVDTPSAGKNFATWNPLSSGGTPSQGNLEQNNSNLQFNLNMPCFPGGKTYAEVLFVSGDDGPALGIETDNANLTSWLPGGDANGWGWYAYSSAGIAYHDGSSSGANDTSGPGNWTTGQIACIAVDLTSPTEGKLSIRLNDGSWSLVWDNIPSVDGLNFWIATGSASGSLYHTYIVNCGQDATFAGEKSPSTVYTDKSTDGVGEFHYEPPAGHLALCTANLPDPGLNNAVAQEKAFSTKIYTGDDGSSETGVGFQPDLTWIKNRDAGYSYIIGDSVRGDDGSAMYFMASNGDGAEDADSGKLVSLDSDGFTVGSHAGAGADDVDYVAWNWKANGSTSPSANTAAGFSIVKWTGTPVNTDSENYSTYTQTITHGLDATVPEMIIAKSRTNNAENDGAESGCVSDWIVYHKDLAADHFLRLNQYGSEVDMSNYYPGPPISSVAATTFVVANAHNMTDTGYFLNYGEDSGMNMQYTGDTYIAYCFASVEGYSKVGSYTGNADADGPFVYCGFRPAYVMFKALSGTTHWAVLDSTRDTYNVIGGTPGEGGALFPSDAQDEYPDSTETGAVVDFLSNGFKVKISWGNYNEDDTTITYYAVAENPFKYANAR
jgi:hypothetical protein